MTDLLRVSFAFSPADRVEVGRLALDGNSAVFEYTPGFEKRRVTLNPMFPPGAPGLLRARGPRAFNGLHGVFADSLPDAWGRFVEERWLRSRGIALERLNVLDHLAIVGRRGRGALVYEPATETEKSPKDVDLDRLSDGIDAVFDGRESSVLGEMLRLGGSSGGARPKVHVALDDLCLARSGDTESSIGFTEWIVKFRASGDRVDSGPLEAAYAEAARRARIAMPRTRLIATDRGPGYFATERFDRRPDGVRLHVLSIAGMLDADWTIPSLTYDDLIDAVRAATRDEAAVAQMFRRMVFNVVAVNRDDHGKQHSVVEDHAGVWRLSPAYDLTLASGPGNEHYMSINGRGRDIRLSDLLAVAKRQSLHERDAKEIIEDVVSVVATLPAIATTFGVTRETLADLKRITGEQVTTLAFSRG